MYGPQRDALHTYKEQESQINNFRSRLALDSAPTIKSPYILTRIKTLRLRPQWHERR